MSQSKERFSKEEVEMILKIVQSTHQGIGLTATEYFLMEKIVDWLIELGGEV